MTAINTNTASINAQYNLSKVNKEMESAMEALSSGKRINSAADDAAGLSIATRMESQVRGLNQAMRNAADGQSMIDTAEGAMDEISNMLQRMRELALQSANDTNTSQDRENLNMEVDQLLSEIDRVVSTTAFNDQRLLDGSGDFTLQIGAKEGQDLSFSVANMSTNSLGSLTEGVTAAGAVTSASVSGTEAETTKTQMTFNGDDTYTFTLNLTTADGVGVYNIVADVTNGSAEDVVDKINEAIRDNSITGNTYQDDTASSVVASFSGNVLTLENSYGGAISAAQTSTTAFAASGSTITFTSVNGGTETAASNVTLGTANSFAATTIVNNNTLTAATAATVGITESGTLTAADVYEIVLDDGAGNDLTVTGAAVGASPSADDGLNTILTAFDALSDKKGYSMAIASNKLTVTRADGVDFTLALGAGASGTGTLTEDETASGAVLTTTAVTTTDGVEAVGDEISNMYLDLTAADTYTLNFSDSATTANETGTFDVEYDGTSAGLTAMASVIGTQINAAFASTHDVSVAVEGGRIKISDANGLSFALEDFASEGNGKIMASVDPGQGTTAAGDGVLLDDTVHASTGTTAAAGVPVASSMALTFSGNDRFAFNISDGTATAVVSNFAADISTAATTADIASEINSALTKAGLNDTITAAAHATTAGLVTLTHANGKEIEISEFSSESTHTVKVEATAVTGNSGFTKFLDDGNTRSDVLSGISMLTASSASDALSVIDEALNDINSQRSELGAISNRLDHTVSNLGNVVVNTEASQSRIEDADFAKVTGDLTKAQIMSQAATAMLAQANASKQGVLSLLQG